MSEIVKPEPGLEQFGDSKGRILTTLDLTDVDNRKLFMRAVQDADVQLTTEVNMPLKIANYLVMDSVIVDKENGEVKPVIKLILIDSDGLAHWTMGDTLLQSLKTVAYVHGKAPWNPPLELTVRTRKNGERSVYWFETK